MKSSELRLALDRLLERTDLDRPELMQMLEIEATLQLADAVREIANAIRSHS